MHFPIHIDVTARQRGNGVEAAACTRRSLFFSEIESQRMLGWLHAANIFMRAGLIPGLLLACNSSQLTEADALALSQMVLNADPTSTAGFRT